MADNGTIIHELTWSQDDDFTRILQNEFETQQDDIEKGYQNDFSELIKLYYEDETTEYWNENPDLLERKKKSEE